MPRTSSGTSGFFFCGMIEEPVQKRSGRSMNWNWALVQSTSSSEKRDRCIIATEAAAQNSMAKSRSETPSSELPEIASKPSSSQVISRWIG